MVLGYHVLSTDINALRKRFKLSVQGENLKSLISMAESLYFYSKPVQLELDELSQLQLPAILHWDFSHFVVLKSVNSRSITILDPALGVISYSYEEAGKHFTGIALELVPLKEFSENQSEGSLSLMDLWSNAEGVGVLLIYVLVLSMLLQVFILAMPFYTQIFIDDVLVNYDYGLLKVLAIGFMLLVLIKCCTELLRSLTVRYLGNTLGLQLGTLICHHLYHLQAEFLTKRHIDDIISRFSSVNQIKSFLGSGVIQVLIDGMMVLSTLVLMTVYSSVLTAISMIALVIYVAIRLVTFKQFYQNNENVLHFAALENTRFIENIRGIQGIKLFCKENERLKTWQGCFIDSINADIKLEKLNISVSFFNNLLRGSENILLIWFGANAVMNNSLSIGMLLAFISFKDQFYRRFFAFTDSLFEIRLLKVHLSRLSDIVLHPVEVEKIISLPQVDKNESLPEGQAILQLRNLSYLYSDTSPPILENINLDIFHGETIAIVGPSGCGKSTLLKLLMCLLQADRGELFYKSRDIRHYGLQNYRHEVAAVLQDDELFSGSIADNISFFETDPDWERVQQSAKTASIHEDILGMPMQYETLLGNMGNALSGGQVQRLLLARALYKQPKILIVDEACSHLEIQKEQVINRTLQAIKLTRIIVAHRPESIRYANKVYLLSSGCLTQMKSVDIDQPGQLTGSSIAA